MVPVLYFCPMSLLQRDHRQPDLAAGSWLAWGSVGLVVAWALWWILPRSVVEPSSTGLQIVAPLVIHAAAALAVGWGLWRRRVPATPGQVALIVLAAAVTMEAVALLLVLFPPTP